MKQTPDTSSQPPRNPWKVNRAGLSTQAAEVARQTIYLPNAQGDTTLWTVESYTRDDSTTGGDSSLALPS